MYKPVKPKFGLNSTFTATHTAFYNDNTLDKGVLEKQ
jgi:hypothetical protein